jgi:lysophospholipase L1-like esterase
MRTRTALSLHCLLLAGLFCCPLAATGQTGATNLPHPLLWENTIRAFETSDKTNPPPRNAILLIGSSSILRWTNAPAQFPDHRLINRGFGGSHLSDSVAFVERIVIPYQPKLVVLYAGDNDLAAGVSPERVLTDFQEFVAKVQRALPETRIAFISIKPSPSRMKFAEPTRTANQLIREFISARPKLIYVDVFTPMLGADGQPRPELFVSDRLHLNPEGYQLWARILKPVLANVDSSPDAKPGGQKK